MIEKLADVKLDVRTGVAPESQGRRPLHARFRSVASASGSGCCRATARLKKEIEELEKLIADKDRQLSNEKFLSGAPAHVVDSLRAKRAEYVAQLEKSLAALNDLQ